MPRYALWLALLAVLLVTSSAVGLEKLRKQRHPAHLAPAAEHVAVPARAASRFAETKGHLITLNGDKDLCDKKIRSKLGKLDLLSWEQVEVR